MNGDRKKGDNLMGGCVLLIICGWGLFMLFRHTSTHLPTQAHLRETVTAVRRVQAVIEPLRHLQAAIALPQHHKLK